MTPDPKKPGAHNNYSPDPLPLLDDPKRPGKHIDQHTGIAPIAEWGCAGIGFQTFKDSSGTHITKGSRKKHRGMASDDIREES